jgi:hypothetical protein
MTRAKRIEILKAARSLADHGAHELAREMFALVGVSYVPAVVS